MFRRTFLQMIGSAFALATLPVRATAAPVAKVAKKQLEDVLVWSRIISSKHGLYGMVGRFDWRTDAETRLKADDFFWGMRQGMLDVTKVSYITWEHDGHRTSSDGNLAYYSCGAGRLPLHDRSYTDNLYDIWKKEGAAGLLPCLSLQSCVIAIREGEDLNCKLHLIRVGDSPLHIMDLRKTCGQIFFFPTAENARQVIEKAFGGKVPEELKDATIIEVPPDQIWRFGVDQEGEWNVQKSRFHFNKI